MNAKNKDDDGLGLLAAIMEEVRGSRADLVAHIKDDAEMIVEIRALRATFTIVDNHIRGDLANPDAPSIRKSLADLHAYNVHQTAMIVAKAEAEAKAAEAAGTDKASRRATHATLLVALITAAATGVAAYAGYLHP